MAEILSFLDVYIVPIKHRTMFQKLSSASVLCMALGVMLLFCVACQSEGRSSNGDLDLLLKDILVKPKNFCTCVLHDHCSDNGTSAACWNFLEVCCEANKIVELPTTSAKKLTEEAFKISNDGNGYNTSCTCVPYYLCEKNNTGIIDTRDDGTSESCENYHDVCCEENKRVMVTVSSTEKTAKVALKINTTGSSQNTFSCVCVPVDLCTENDGEIIDNKENQIAICENDSEVCCKIKETIIINDVRTPPPPSSENIGCGKRNPEGIGFRLIFDEEEQESLYGEFPWMATILRKVEINGSDVNVYHCGGALIHPQVVVTAAHCISKTETPRLMIRAGDWDTLTNKELYPHQDREVSSFIIHPQYYRARLYNDIALLFLKTPVTIAENVNVVCLPSQNEVIESSKCFATGWGRDVFGKKGVNKVLLKKVQIPIVQQSRCQEILRNKTKLGKYFKLHESFVCAGGVSGKDTCKGDGGGPLVCPIRGREDEERYAQVGIVAWGNGCGETSVPGVYVNVALFRDWIDEQMKLKNPDLQSYN